MERTDGSGKRPYANKRRDANPLRAANIRDVERIFRGVFPAEVVQIIGDYFFKPTRTKRIRMMR